jgi:hypothetical protein
MNLNMSFVYAGLLCQVGCLAGHHSLLRASHQLSSSPSFEPTWPPSTSPSSPSAADSSPPPPFALPPSYVPSEGPSQLFPFMAPSPLVVPVIGNPSPPMLTGIVVLLVNAFSTFNSLPYLFLRTEVEFTGKIFSPWSLHRIGIMNFQAIWIHHVSQCKKSALHNYLESFCQVQVKYWFCLLSGQKEWYVRHKFSS